MTRTSDVVLAVYVVLVLAGVLTAVVGAHRGRASWTVARSALTDALADFAVFSGRATRAQFWWFTWWTLVLGTATSLLGRTLPAGLQAFHGINAAIGVLVLVPHAAVLSRRLHDVGRSGQWLWLALTGFGVLLLLAWALLPTRPTSTGGDLPPSARDVAGAPVPAPAHPAPAVTPGRWATCRLAGLIALLAAITGSVLQATSAVLTSTHHVGTLLYYLGLIAFGLSATACRPRALLRFSPRTAPS